MSKLLVEAGLFIGIPVVIILFLFRKKNRTNNFLLAISVFSIWYTLLVNNLNATQQIMDYPHFYRTANITVYLIMPFFYLYARNSFYPGVFWRKRDWLFLLPTIIYCIDLMPLFLSSYDQKVKFIQESLKDSVRFFSIPEGWLGIKGFHHVFRYLFSLFVMGLLVRLIVRNWHFDRKDRDDSNQPLFWFIFILTFMYLLMLIPGLFGVLLGSSWYSLSFLNVNLAISLLSVALFILFSPGILYGFYPLPDIPVKESSIQSPLNNLNNIEKDKEEETIKLTESPVLYLKEEELSDILQKIELFMTRNRPYLNQRYSIHDLARDIEIPVYQLSPVINQHFGSNFSSWLNKFRVDHFIEICKLEHKKDLTFEALSFESGFSNRVSFIKAFKKEKGTTPGNYISGQNKEA